MISSKELESLASLALKAVKEGGDVVMHHRGKVKGEAKADGSPVTLADKQAERVITTHLETSNIAIVGEETFAQNAAENPPEDSAAPPETFWLVDALDGTKGYLSGERDFTVNIALVHQAEPVLGVVYAPALNRIFGGVVGKGAWQANFLTGHQGSISTRAFPKEGLRVLASSRHQNQAEAIKAIEKKLGGQKVAELVSMSSSVKFCIVACGEADFYLRTGTTMEWDTAAGNAVLLAAGGRVELQDGSPLRYGKEGFKNDGFYAFGGG